MTLVYHLELPLSPFLSLLRAALSCAAASAIRGTDDTEAEARTPLASLDLEPPCLACCRNLDLALAGCSSFMAMAMSL